MAVVLLDSTVIVGFLDADDAFHADAVRRIAEILGRDTLVTSAVTYAEILTGAAAGHHAKADVEGFFRDVISDVYPLDEEVAARAAELRAGRPTLRLPDAAILATADVYDVTLVLSGDQGLAGVPGLACEVSLLTPNA